MTEFRKRDDALQTCYARKRQTQKQKSPQLRGLGSLFSFTRDVKSFPLDRRWRLTADVVHDTGNTVHFVDNAVRHAA